MADIIPIINLILCIAILLLGLWAFKKKNNKMALLTGIAFGLFGISHLVNILGYTMQYEGAMIIVRLIAYLLVVFAMYNLAMKRKKYY
ncbi:hypothetical protein KY346_06620 [Candidatus Woesearchaeota archaeon]|nr:hypothetical protein [Candidatus Woesearchaeota archaeon]